MSKRIIITGATGLIGTRLCKALIERGDEVTIFSTNISNARRKIPCAKNYVEWNYGMPLKWEKDVEGIDAIIHLAGANIFSKRWSNIYKKNILNSRIISTKNLVEAIKKTNPKPSVFISSSAVGYYGDKENELIDETSLPGNDFLANVCKQWEEEANQVEKLGVRHVSIRTGIVLNPNEGALKQMLLPFKLFVGGPIGSGRQWFPWIHMEDIIRIYLFALDNHIVNGAVNAASPNPVTMKDFAKALGKVLHRPSIFSVPKFAMKIVLGEVADVVTASQRVYPQKLIEYKYKFRFEKLNEALNDLLK
ncbi:MAG: TIGR01777 family oxidoreductase [Ignavibacteriaceae bacterium]